MSDIPSRRFLLPLSAAIAAALAGAAPSGMLVPEASAQVMKKPDEDERDEPLLIEPPQLDTSEFLAHRSHSSHSSHRSHSSHYSGSGGYGGGGGWSGGGGGGSGGDGTSARALADTPKEPPPAPPKPVTVSFAAFPGGRVSVDGIPSGTDSTGVLTLKPGSHRIRVENRFLGTNESIVTVTDGQTGKVTIEW